MFTFQLPNKVASLLVVRVSREGDVLDLAVERELLSVHGSDILRIRQDVLGERSLDTVASHDAAVLLLRTPGLEQLPGQTALHHAGAGQDHARTDVLELIDPLEVGDVAELEGIVDGDLAPDLLVHGGDGHTFLGEHTGVVDGDIVQLCLWVRRPVLLEDQEKLLGAALIK